MERWDDLARYIGLSKEDDQRLRSLWPAVKPEIPRVVERFYERAMASPATADLLADRERVERLSRTLERWLEQLFCHPIDADYFERRLKIGHRHVEVGLDARFMYAAMRGLEEDLGVIARGILPPEDLPQMLESIGRRTSFDLALMTATYIESRERRIAAAHKELLVSHLRLPVLLVSASGAVSAATKEAARLFGGRELLGLPWTEVVPVEIQLACALTDHVKAALESRIERVLSRVDAVIARESRSFRIQIVPIEPSTSSDEGRTMTSAALLLQFEDLTEVIALEGRMRRAEALAQLGAMSASVAHELRNPLAGISGAIQVIGRSLPIDAPYLPVMRKVEAEIHRLNDLVTDLLRYARPGTVRLAPCDLAVPVRRAIELVEDAAPDVVFALEGAGAALADADSVQQIVLNLLQNAAEAQHGSGRVEVALSDGRISVSDAGSGIAKELKEKIFEPFFTTKSRGTGLGLAISRRAATAMGGTLTLGEGTLPGACFVLALQPTDREST